METLTNHTGSLSAHDFSDISLYEPQITRQLRNHWKITELDKQPTKTPQNYANIISLI